MFKLETNPIVTISKEEIKTLKEICNIALSQIIHIETKLDCGNKRDTARELNITLLEFSLVCSMIAEIKKI